MKKKKKERKTSQLSAPCLVPALGWTHRLGQEALWGYAGQISPSSWAHWALGVYNISNMAMPLPAFYHPEICSGLSAAANSLPFTSLS